MRFVISDTRTKFASAFGRIEKRIAGAATAAMDETKTALVADDRAAIAAGGFGVRWQNTLRGQRYPHTGQSINSAVYVKHKIPYAGVFEHGARISGSPLLWLPLPNVPQKVGGRRMTPQNYVQYIGRLSGPRRGSAGRPFLFGYIAGSATAQITIGRLRRASRGRFLAKPPRGLRAVPVFIGIPAVEEKKRFDLHGAFVRAASALPGRYARHVQEGR